MGTPEDAALNSDAESDPGSDLEDPEKLLETLLGELGTLTEVSLFDYQYLGELRVVEIWVGSWCWNRMISALAFVCCSRTKYHEILCHQEKLGI